MAIDLALELRFLLDCAHVTLSEEQKCEATNLLNERFDGERLYQLASAANLTSLLYCGLVQLDSLPAQLITLKARLANETTEAAVLFEYVYPQQLARIVKAWAQEGIDAMLLKGYALGVQAYRQPALRPYTDFDLLVRESHLRRAEKVLSDMGYRPDETEHPRQWYEDAEHQHIVPYVHGAALHVELHRTLIHPSSNVRIDYDDLWAMAQPLAIGDAKVGILLPEYQLLHLCIHAVHVHRVAEIGLKPLWDIYELLLTYGGAFDWRRVIETSAAWGAGKQTHLMLRMVNDLFGTIVTPDVLSALTDEPLDDSLLHYSEVSLTAGMFGGLPDSSGLAEAWAQQGTRRLQTVLRRLLPPRSVIAEYYGLGAVDWRALLRYPHWIFMMIRRHTLAGLRLLRRDPMTVAAAEEEHARRQLIGWLTRA